MTNRLIAMERLSLMGDWLRLKKFNSVNIKREIKKFENEWKVYNPRKENNRFGLSITSLDGKLRGVPDLDSLYEYNKENKTNLVNQSFKTTTLVFHQSPELQKILKPFLPWLGRSHFLKINRGGFFPDHYDIDKLNFDSDEIRLIGFVKKEFGVTYTVGGMTTLLHQLGFSYKKPKGVPGKVDIKQQQKFINQYNAVKGRGRGLFLKKWMKTRYSPKLQVVFFKWV